MSPEHLRKLPFLLEQAPGRGSCPAARCIVIGLGEDAIPPSEGALPRLLGGQQRLCEVLQVSANDMVLSLMHGHVPDDVVVHRIDDTTKQLIWFAVTEGDKRAVVPIDITPWNIVPGVAIRDCRCVVEKDQHRAARCALVSLRELIEENSHDLREQVVLRAHQHMQRIFDHIRP